MRTKHGTRLANSDQNEKSEIGLVGRFGHAPIFYDSVISARSTGFAGHLLRISLPYQRSSRIITLSQ